MGHPYVVQASSSHNVCGDASLQNSTGSPTIDLVIVLVKIFSSIILGYACMRNGFIEPSQGDTKGIKFLQTNIAFPLLIFNTVATARLGSIDFGVVLACSLAKLLVYWGVWILSFRSYQPDRPKGQRFLTSTVFAFFAVAGDDFATGFPVINALYGSSMVVYIAANSLVGSLLMVPMTLALFELGKGLQQRDVVNAAHSSAEQRAPGSMASARHFLRNLLLNPVIFMTCAGLLFQVVFGSFLISDPASSKLRLPDPFASIIDLWTGPFAMLALLSTGLSLTSASLRFWPMVLVLLKLMVCGYLSYALGLAFVYKEPKQQLHDFTFFYGSIPTSSAPLVFATVFDPSAVETIASAVLFGYILAGPNMFVTALFLSEESKDMSTTLNEVQSVAGIMSAACAGLLLLFFGLTRKSWTWSGGVLGLYSAVLVCYGLVDFYLAHECQHRDLPYLKLVLFNFLQKLCTLIVLYLQIALATGWNIAWHKRWQAWTLLAVASSALAFITHPVALDQLCHLSPGMAVNIGTVISSLLLFATIAGVTSWSLCRRRGASAPQQACGLAGEDALLQTGPGEARHPAGVVKAMCVAQGLRVLMQVVNSIDSVTRGNDVSGGRVQVLIIEQFLEVGQGVVLLVAMAVQECDAARVALAAECLRSLCPQRFRRAETEEAVATPAAEAEPVIVFPDLHCVCSKTIQGLT